MGAARRCHVWPPDDLFRLMGLLPAQGVVALSAAGAGLRDQFREPAAIARDAKGDREKYLPVLEYHQAAASLDLALAEAAEADECEVRPATLEACWEQLRSIEVATHTEMKYVYGPDWDVKPGKLVSRKGTWLKPNTQFSWELQGGQKLYLPHGVAVPVLQIGNVADQTELRRHEWGGQHLRVWLKPTIVRTLEERQGVWFVYWPHFEDRGQVVVAVADTWLKRTTQMSGELQPFELIYVPRGLALRLSGPPCEVEEEWEKNRHQHVHLHRCLRLSSAPLTIKQDQYDIFIGQSEENVGVRAGGYR